jgi:hypothetical protein
LDNLFYGERGCARIGDRADEKTGSTAENGWPDGQALLNLPHVIRDNHD